MSTSLEDSARRAGAHQWAEARLFEILGGWAATARPVEVALMLDRHSAHSAWRATQWWDRLPVLADLDRPSLCAPGTPGAAGAARHLAGLEGTVPRLAAVYRVVMPRVWASYEEHRTAAGHVADGSTLRILQIVAADLARDWHEGEAQLQALLDGPARVRQAADAAAAVEEILVPGD